MIILKLYYHLNAYLKTGFYKLLFGKKFKVGKSLTFRKGFSLIIEEAGSIRIGKNCFFNNYCTLASKCSVEIGDFTIFGENVKVYDHNHCFADKTLSIKQQGFKTSPIVIGNHCWIASNVVILRGVTIGDRCVIGAGCVVHKDVPAGTVMVNKQNYIYNDR